MIVAELGWGVVQRSIWQKLYNIPLEIVLFGHKVRTEALADTGNLLKDPLDGSPWWWSSTVWSRTCCPSISGPC